MDLPAARATCHTAVEDVVVYLDITKCIAELLTKGRKGEYLYTKETPNALVSSAKPSQPLGSLAATSCGCDNNDVVQLDSSSPRSLTANFGGMTSCRYG
jgi:hypothetical protein